MTYFKGVLSAAAAVTLAELIPGLWWVLTSGTKATGIAAVWGGLIESLFSFRFWVLAILFFALFYVASRLGNKALRVLLFWVPTLTVLSVTIAAAGLLTYVLIRFRHP